MNARPLARVCSDTGFGLVSSPSRVFRIAKTSYGPVSPQARSVTDDRRYWGRYDTPGRTLYGSTSELTSYLEVLAPFRTEIAGRRRALQPVADSLGISLETLWRRVVRDWDENGSMDAMWLPRSFREGRAIYELEFPEGWWIDINSVETISTLRDRHEDGLLPDINERHMLTVAHLTGERRDLTTAIATYIRETTILDDGTFPLGIHFHSKHGHPSGQSGGCWAYWMRSTDIGLPEPIRVLNEFAIDPESRVFKAAQRHCKISVR